MACLTGLVTLTSTRIYDLHYSTYTRVTGSVSIHSLCTVVLDYGELLAYWFTLHRAAAVATRRSAAAAFPDALLPPLPPQRHQTAATAAMGLGDTASSEMQSAIAQLIVV